MLYSVPTHILEKQLFIFLRSCYDKMMRASEFYLVNSSLKTWFNHTRIISFVLKNKTNHPTSSNSHPSATAKKQYAASKIGGGLQNQQEHHIILTKYEAVHRNRKHQYWWKWWENMLTFTSRSSYRLFIINYMYDTCMTQPRVKLNTGNVY